MMAMPNTTHQGTNGISLGEVCLNEMAADESRGSGNQHTFHYDVPLKSVLALFTQPEDQGILYFVSILWCQAALSLRLSLFLL